MHATVSCGVYKKFNIMEGAVIDKQVVGEAVWTASDRMLLCPPLLMLARLGDTPSEILSKLHKTKLNMVQ